MLLVYPKIPDSKNCPHEQCVAFEKYDGTNLHWVWEVELGWYALVRAAVDLIWMRWELQNLMLHIQV